jgi:hypothetical protein
LQDDEAAFIAATSFSVGYQMYFAASAIMTIVTTTNAAICTQKLLAKPALLLVCVFICGHLPLVSLVPEHCGVRAFSTVTQPTSLFIIDHRSEGLLRFE